MSAQPVFTVSSLLFTMLFLTSAFYSLRSLPTLSLPNLATALILLTLVAVLSYWPCSFPFPLFAFPWPHAFFHIAVTLTAPAGHPMLVIPLNFSYS